MSDLREFINLEAKREGFDAVRITPANLPRENSENLKTYIGHGHHGTMSWMEREPEKRSSPQTLWPDARSVIVLAMNYGPEANPLDELAQKSDGLISVYARGADYHDVIKKKLKRIARGLCEKAQCDVKVFVDTAPIMEKPLAERAGIGWQGKHTNLVSREFGSWIFLGSIFTTADIEPDEPEEDHCGTCRSCLDICPTEAFVGPRRIDASKCISYLTIEHKGHIEEKYRAAMGNRIYGCDDCLAVCPWNKFAAEASEIKLKAKSNMVMPALKDLAGLDDTAFRTMFSGSPVKRIKRDRFVRNVLIAIGNSGNTDLSGGAQNLLRDESPLVRAMAVWALLQLLPAEKFSGLRDEYLPLETDAQVQAEWYGKVGAE